MQLDLSGPVQWETGPAWGGGDHQQWNAVTSGKNLEVVSHIFRNHQKLYRHISL